MLRVNLPALSSAAGVGLDIGARAVSISLPAGSSGGSGGGASAGGGATGGDGAVVSVPLPHDVDAAASRALFDRKRRQLVVTLPLLPAAGDAKPGEAAARPAALSASQQPQPASQQEPSALDVRQPQQQPETPQSPPSSAAPRQQQQPQQQPPQQPQQSKTQNELAWEALHVAASGLTPGDETGALATDSAPSTSSAGGGSRPVSMPPSFAALKPRILAAGADELD